MNGSTPITKTGHLLPWLHQGGIAGDAPRGILVWAGQFIWNYMNYVHNILGSFFFFFFFIIILIQPRTQPAWPMIFNALVDYKNYALQDTKRYKKLNLRSKFMIYNSLTLA